MKAFQSFQESVLYEAVNTAAYLSSAEECRPTLCTSGEGSSECGTDCSCVLEGLSEVVKTLLSPCQRRRRTQVLMSLLQEGKLKALEKAVKVE